MKRRLELMECEPVGATQIDPDSSGVVEVGREPPLDQVG